MIRKLDNDPDARENLNKKSNAVGTYKELKSNDEKLIANTYFSTNQKNNEKNENTARMNLRQPYNRNLNQYRPTGFSYGFAANICKYCHKARGHYITCPNIVCFQCGQRGHIRSNCANLTNYRQNFWTTQRRPNNNNNSRVGFYQAEKPPVNIRNTRKNPFTKPVLVEREKDISHTLKPSNINNHKTIFKINLGSENLNAFMIFTECGKQLHAIIDTGSEISLVKSRVICELNLITKVFKSDTELVDVQGNAITQCGSVVMVLTDKINLTFNHKFIVVQDNIRFGGDILVGLDFMSKHSASICWKRKIFKLYDISFTLLTEDEVKVGYLKLDSEIEKQCQCSDCLYNNSIRINNRYKKIKDMIKMPLSEQEVGPIMKLDEDLLQINNVPEGKMLSSNVNVFNSSGEHILSPVKDLVLPEKGVVCSRELVLPEKGVVGCSVKELVLPEKGVVCSRELVLPEKGVVGCSVKELVLPEKGVVCSRELVLPDKGVVGCSVKELVLPEKGVVCSRELVLPDQGVVGCSVKELVLPEKGVVGCSVKELVLPEKGVVGCSVKELVLPEKGVVGSMKPELPVQWEGDVINDVVKLQLFSSKEQKWRDSSVSSRTEKKF
ncbi:uncharacterized protein LOC135132123 isoform X1 [Zophobas morio]|uniref:uncharacterized protein LOC135132123 isoform X1 n=1 Tax=Zophobas morio TaxID=2755281 RepID=UPI003083570E